MDSYALRSQGSFLSTVPKVCTELCKRALTVDSNAASSAGKLLQLDLKLQKLDSVNSNHSCRNCVFCLHCPLAADALVVLNEAFMERGTVQHFEKYTSSLSC